MSCDEDGSLAVRAQVAESPTKTVTRTLSDKEKYHANIKCSSAT
jgi:hypothetical protein